ncbi:hypothetical protein Hanom_Chr07g00627271 [Helianthus anomalus]
MLVMAELLPTSPSDPLPHTTRSNTHRVGGHLVERLFMDRNIRLPIAIATVFGCLIQEANK